MEKGDWLCGKEVSVKWKYLSEYGVGTGVTVRENRRTPSWLREGRELTQRAGNLRITVHRENTDHDDHKKI